MKIKVYQKYPDGFYKEHDFTDDEVLSVTLSDGNYVILLCEEDYFGKLVYLFNADSHRIEICNPSLEDEKPVDFIVR